MLALLTCSPIKAQLVGIRVLLTQESYTSKASFLDLDPIPEYNPDRKVQPIFSDKQDKCGLYRSSGKRFINADVNGAYNIIRKVAPKAFKGIEGLVVHPVRMDRIKQTKNMVS